MATYRVETSFEAEARLVKLYRHLAKESSHQTARQYVASIEAYCNGFADVPHRGTRRDDLLPGLRTVGLKRRITIAFTVEDDVRLVTILGIFYGGQNVEVAFWNED